MAKILISSTCYDLKEIRDQLGRFLKTMGHEPILSDQNDIFYDPDLHTHTSCVEAVSKCDMVIFIVGGRFGGPAIPDAYESLDGTEIYNLLDKNLAAALEQAFKDKIFSITQLEVLHAIQLGKPVYTFVSKDVHNDHNLYEKNKRKNLDIEYPSISKQETAAYIFEFINVMRKRCVNNAIYTFDTEEEIEKTLLKQFTHIFDKGLSSQPYKEQIENISRSTIGSKNIFARQPIISLVIVLLLSIVICFIVYHFFDRITPALMTLCVCLFVYSIVNSVLSFLDKIDRKDRAREIVNELGYLIERHFTRYIINIVNSQDDNKYETFERKTEDSKVHNSTIYLNDLAQKNNMDASDFENVLESIFFSNGEFDFKNSIIRVLLNSGYYDDKEKCLVANTFSLHNECRNKEIIMNQFSVLLSLNAIKIIPDTNIVKNDIINENIERPFDSNSKFAIEKDILIWASLYIKQENIDSSDHDEIKPTSY